MRKLVFLVIAVLSIMSSDALSTIDILSLDASRTGDENTGNYGCGDHRYLTSASMSDATNVLINAGFTIGTTDRFIKTNIAGAKVLYTGTVSTDFTSEEITDIMDFVDNGGGLVIQRDWGNYYPAANPLAAAFGVSFNTGPFGPSGVASPVNKTVDHAIWNGPAGAVTSYNQVLSSSISGAASIGVHSTAADQSAIAVLLYGQGKVVFLSDMNAWDNVYTKVYDSVSPTAGNNNAIVWENIFHYAVPEPATLVLLALGGLLIRRK